MIKRIFSVFITIAIIAALLPVTVSAAQKEIANVVGDFEVEGIPNSALPIGSGYEVRVEQAPGMGDNSPYYLYIYYPASQDRDPARISNALSDGKSFIKWNGITISWPSGTNTWVPNNYATFDVIDDTSSTTVTSSNIKLINFSRREIDYGTYIRPTFEIVDYNVNESEVSDDMTPYLTGYSSNDSFALTSDHIDVERILNTASGKMTFRVTLPLKYTGVGNRLSFTMAYTTLSGSLRTIDCSTTIPYTVEGTDDDDDDDDETRDDTPIPYIIVDSYDYGGSSVTAGEEFSLTLRLRNTSTDHSLENIVMSVSPMGVFSMASSSNTFYINKLAAGSIMEKVITINTGLTKVTDDEDANSINIKFSYQYGIKENDAVKLHSGDSSESITLPVDFPDRFELGVPEYNSRVFAGEEIYLTVPMVNKGRSSVYNLSASVRGEMANPGQTQYIGNLSAGTESSADFSILFDEPGTYSGEVVVTYEDTNMNPKEVISQFSVTVQQMEFDSPSMDMPMMPEEPAVEVDAEPEKDPTKPIKIVLALLVGSMSAYTTVAKAKAKRSIYLDEDI